MNTSPKRREVVQVYVWHSVPNTYQHVAVVDRDKLLAVSWMARLRFAAQQASEHPTDRRPQLVLDARRVSAWAVHLVCAWVNGLDDDLGFHHHHRHPHCRRRQPLTAAHAQSAALTDLLRLHYTAEHLGLERAVTGDELTRALQRRITAEPLRILDFVLVAERCAVAEPHLLELAVADFAERRCGNAALRSPDEAQIEAWARSIGLWPRMLAKEKEILRKRELEHCRDIAAEPLYSSGSESSTEEGGGGQAGGRE